jgi:hypothetical protein
VRHAGGVRAEVQVQLVLNLLLARRDDGIGRQAIVDKFINVGFN